MLTPFKENEDVDYDMHIRNMERWNDRDLAGYVVLGSNSEAAYLTEKEKLTMIELTVKHAAKGRLVIAGTGMESARETIALTNQAAGLGAHAALVLTPCYYGDRMDDEALIGFFRRVADNSEIPVLIYNVPKFTHINVSAKIVRELSRHENIVGMKDSTGDVPQLVKFKNVMAEDFNLMVGTAAAWYPGLTLGVQASIMALANCAPNECAKVQKAFEEGNLEESREIYERMFPVNTAVTATFGVPGLKCAAELTGYEGGYVRSPLLPLKEEEKASIREILSFAKMI